MTDEARVGDWVCFQQLGSPSYALVLYVLHGNSSFGDRVVTTCGETYQSSIIEIRRASCSALHMMIDHDAEQRQTIATLTKRVRELEAQSNYWQMAFEEKRDAYQCTQQKIAELEAELARVKGAV